MLRQVRERADLTGEELSRRLGWSPSTVSRMENGRRPSTTTDVIQYAVMCGVPQSEVQPIVEFTRMAERQQGYYLSDRRIGGAFQSLIFHESAAEHSLVYEPQVVNGLMQTPAYARAMVTGLNPNRDVDNAAGAVRTRMERQRVLSLPKPARFTFYLHEHALRLRVGSDQIMHEQLLHIVLTAALDNVTVRVVPSAAGERSALGGSVRVMEFHEHRPMVYMDPLWGGGMIIDDSGFVRGYRRELMPRLEDVALDEDESRKFVAGLADEYDRKSQRRAADVVVEARPPQRRAVGLPCGGVEPATPIHQ